MSAYLQSSKIFNNPSAKNIVSVLNSTNTADDGFLGSPESCNDFTNVTVTVNTDVLLSIYVEQSADGAHFIYTNQFNAPGGLPPNYATTSKTFPITLAYIRVTALNVSGLTNSHLNLITKLLTTAVDVSVSNLPLDASGNINVDVANWSVTTSIPVVNSGVYTPTSNGISSQYEIIANAVNNCQTYYQDETKGVDVSDGWQFTSTALTGKNSKINWYMYAPTTDVVITDLSNNPTNTYYTVVDNVGVEFPMIYIYTKPTSPTTKTTGGTAGSSWYQSKFVYQANQAGAVGEYLLYVGNDPTTIRPDLTHINLRQLDSLCLGTLQPDELVMSASLQTSSNILSLPGNFSLTMSKFGVVIAPVNTTLRTDATGALAVSVDGSVAVTGAFYPATQPVSITTLPALATGANTIGSVNILNSFHLNTWTYPDISGNWVSDSADLTYYSLADLYMLSAGSVTSALGMNFIGQYSPDNVNWFDSGNTLTLTATVPQGIAIGILTASPYIRLIADPANIPTDVATNVQLWIPSKAI